MSLPHSSTLSSPTHRKAALTGLQIDLRTLDAPPPAQPPPAQQPPSLGRRLGSAISSWSSSTNLLRHSSVGNFVPTGEWWQATYYIISTVGSPFLLGLPFATAQLGWVAGLLILCVAYPAVVYTSRLTARLHEYKGTRHNRYRELGQAVWGKTRGAWVVLPFQTVVNVGMCVCYPIIAGQSLRGACVALAAPSSCSIGLSWWIVLFSSVHLILVVLPDFSSLSWVIALGAGTTVGFSVLATVGAGMAGRVTDVTYALQGSTANKALNAFSAMGGITLLYGNTVLLETQSTLKADPSAVPPMLRAVMYGYTLVFALLVAVVVSGYWAFGAAVQPLVLDSIGAPVWLVVAANVMVVVNSVAGYLTFAHTLFDLVDLKIMMSHWTGLEFQGGPVLILKRFSFRWIFVVLTAALAVCLPFFQDFMGVLGGIGYAPLCFILPCLMWLQTQRGALPWYEVALCWALIVAFAGVMVLATVGAVRALVVHSSTYQFFS